VTDDRYVVVRPGDDPTRVAEANDSTVQAVVDPSTAGTSEAAPGDTGSGRLRWAAGGVGAATGAVIW
jgi:hypothetical protein